MAKKCFIGRKITGDNLLKCQKDLDDMLKIVVLCLQEENKKTLSGKVLHMAQDTMKNNNCSISQQDIPRLYNKMSDQNRDYLRFDETLFE